MMRRLGSRLPHMIAHPTSAPAAPAAPASRMRRAIILVGVVLITLLIGLNRGLIEDLAAFGYFGAFLVMALSNATLILPAPGLIFVFALGNSLHPLLVGLCAGLGATLGETTGYIAGYSGVAIMPSSQFVAQVRRWMERRGGLTVFALSIIPNPLFDIAGVLAGASRMHLWRFLALTFGGKLIQSTGIALAGSLSLTWVQDLLSG